MKREINNLENITEDFLNNIDKNDETFLNLTKIPKNNIFLDLINYIVLDKGAKIIDKKNIIEQEKTFENSYQIKIIKSGEVIKRYNIGDKLDEGDNMLLPLGSVVELKDNQKFMKPQER